MRTNGLLFNSSDFNGESNLFGSRRRKKACKDSGLTGAEKRACAKQLRASGWKKGMPIPASMGGVTMAEVEAAPAPLPTAKPVPLVDSVEVAVDTSVASGLPEKAETPAAEEKTPAPAEKSKTMMYIIIGVVLLVIIIAAVVMMRKKPA